MTELPNGCRLIQSDIGPVIPVDIVAKHIGYTRSAISNTIHKPENAALFAPFILNVSVKGTKGYRKRLCITKEGMEELIAHLRPIDRDNLPARIGTFREVLMSKRNAPAQMPDIRAELEEARDLAMICGKSPESFQAVILKKYGKTELADVLQPVLTHGESGWYNPSGLVELCNDPLLTPERINQFLANYREGGEWRPFQYRDGRLWRLTKRGMEHGREYQYNLGNGHSEPRISWRASVLYACGLKRDIAPDQMALPERAGR